MPVAPALPCRRGRERWFCSATLPAVGRRACSPAGCWRLRFCPLPLPGFLENRGRQLLPHLPLSGGLSGGMVAGPCWWGSGSSSLPTPRRGGTWLLPAGLPQGTGSDQTRREGERACDQTANDHTPTSRAAFGVPLRQAPLGAPRACLPSPPGSQDPTWVPVTFPGPAVGPRKRWEEEEGSFGSRGKGSPCWGLGGAL